MTRPYPTRVRGTFWSKNAPVTRGVIYERAQRGNMFYRRTSVLKTFVIINRRCVFARSDGKCRTTLSKFAESIDKASQGEFTDTDVSQALLSTFSRLDTPISPFAKGNALFVSGAIRGRP